MPTAVETTTADLKKAAETTYQASVREAAENRQIDQRAFRDALFLLGKSLSDFEQDVSTLKARRQAAQDLDAARTMASEIATAEAKAKKAGQKLAQAREKAAKIIREAEQPAWDSQKALDALVAKKRTLETDATRVLNSTAAVEIRQKADELRREVAGLQSWLQGPGIERALGFLSQRKKVQAKIDRGGPGTAPALRKELERLGRQIETDGKLHDEIKATRERIQDLNRQIDEIEQKVFDPDAMRWS